MEKVNAFVIATLSKKFKEVYFCRVVEFPEWTAAAGYN